MNENTSQSDDKLMRSIAFAMQGMAIWYLLTGVVALAFVTLVLLLGDSGSGDPEVVGVSTITGAEVTGGALAGAFLLGGFSWAMQGRSFLRPRWSVILIPGLAGSVAAQVFDLMDWPVSVLIGGFVAFWMIRKRLESAPSNDSQP